MGNSSTTVQKAEPWDEAAPHIKKGLDQASTLYDQGGFVVDPWQGRVTVDQDPTKLFAENEILVNYYNQKQALGDASNAVRSVQGQTMSGGVNPYLNAGVYGAFTTPNAAGFDSAISQMTGDGYDDDLRNRLRQNTTESIMPGINATFGGSGMTGSSLHQMNLAKGLGSGMAQTEAQFLNRAQDRQLQAGAMAQQARDAQIGQRLGAGQALESGMQGSRAMALQAAAMMPGMTSAQNQPAQMVNQIGDERTRRAQIELQNQILQYTQNQTKDIDAVNNYLALTSGLGGQFGTNTASSQNNLGIMGILGGGLQGAGLLSMLFGSDARIKRNIARIGNLPSGIPIYSYNYIWSDAPQIGVMAQDLQTMLPGAVHMHPSGFMMVDYAEVLRHG